MSRRPQKYRMVLITAIVGLVLVCVGLWLASLSNPRKFSLDVAADRQINILAISGLGCTIGGIGLLLTAISQTTKSMSPQQRSQVNIGVGVGFILQLAGLYGFAAGGGRELVGLLLVVAGVPLMIWGMPVLRGRKGLLEEVRFIGRRRRYRADRIDGFARAA